MWEAGDKILELSLADPQGEHQQETGSEAKGLGLKPATLPWGLDVSNRVLTSVPNAHPETLYL